MKSSFQSERPSKWSSSLWRSGSGHSDWRQWGLCYTNQEMDQILKRETSKEVGVQAGALAKGFDEDHFEMVFNEAFTTNKEVRSVFRLSFPENHYVYIFFLLLPLNDQHMATFYVDVSPYFSREGDLREWSKSVSTEFEHYGLKEEALEALEKEKERMRAMLADW